jgi:hypothetical protein
MIRTSTVTVTDLCDNVHFAIDHGATLGVYRVQWNPIVAIAATAVHGEKTTVVNSEKN